MRRLFCGGHFAWLDSIWATPGNGKDCLLDVTLGIELAMAYENIFQVTTRLSLSASKPHWRYGHRRKLGKTATCPAMERHFLKMSKASYSRFRTPLNQYFCGTECETGIRNDSPVGVSARTFARAHQFACSLRTRPLEDLTTCPPIGSLPTSRSSRSGNLVLSNA